MTLSGGDRRALGLDGHEGEQGLFGLRSRGVWVWALLS